jgi:hypothetical protein
MLALLLFLLSGYSASLGLLYIIRILIRECTSTLSIKILAIFNRMALPALLLELQRKRQFCRENSYRDEHGNKIEAIAVVLKIRHKHAHVHILA